MQEEHQNITWRAFDRLHEHKDPDWFWGIGIVATAIAVISIFAGNPLFGIIIVIATITLFLHAIKKPEYVKTRVAEGGLSVDNSFFPFAELESFCIHTDGGKSHLIVKSKRAIISRIVIPVEKTDEHTAREALIQYLPEKKLTVPFSHQVIEFLGL